MMKHSMSVLTSYKVHALLSNLKSRYKLRENKKLRSILERLRNHSQIITVDQKPIVLKWENGSENASSVNDTIKCDPCDPCDRDNHEKQKPSTISLDNHI